MEKHLKSCKPEGAQEQVAEEGEALLNTGPLSLSLDVSLCSQPEAAEPGKAATGEQREICSPADSSQTSTASPKTPNPNPVPNPKPPNFLSDKSQASPPRGPPPEKRQRSIGSYGDRRFSASEAARAVSSLAVACVHNCWSFNSLQNEHTLAFFRALREDWKPPSSYR